MRFMAAERSTSPALEASTSVAMAIQSLSWFTLPSRLGLIFKLMLPRWMPGGRGGGKILAFAMHGERRAARDQANAAGDQQHAGPAPGADRLMQKHAGKKRRDHVAERGGRKDIGEVGPGERGKVSVKETGETEDADDDPGIEKGVEDAGPVGEIHPAQIA